MTFAYPSLAAILTTAALPAAADLAYEVINNSNLTLMEFYASPVSDNSWGEDLLTVRVLPSRQAETFIIEAGRQCDYALRFIFENGQELVDTADLCEGTSYTLERALTP